MLKITAFNANLDITSLHILLSVFLSQHEMKNSTLKTILWLAIFSIAMAMLESAVVIYLREMYYPGKSLFPLQPMDAHIVVTELFRELATLVMLLAIGILTGRNRTEKFGFFLFCFAVWDIFYYLFLKVFIGWPESLMTWDILFLIPVVWSSPVIAPLIVSLTMIAFSFFISCFTDKNLRHRLGKIPLILAIIGSVIIIFSFCLDYSRYILDHFTIKELWSLPDKEALFNLEISYVPRSFNWWIFFMGEGIILSGIVFFVKKSYTKKHP